MLEGTKRKGAPIRSEFIQKPKEAGSDRGNMLRVLKRNEKALDGYLLIHALASASEPWSTQWPVETWLNVMRLNERGTSDGRAAWARSVRALVSNNLITKKPRRFIVDYQLLRESGSGEAYFRPTEKKHGTWFTLPHEYWLDEWDVKLTFSEKRMLLVALDQKDGFELPAERAPKWYGVSETSAQEGLAGLVKRDMLRSEDDHVSDPRSHTGWRLVRRYTTQGVWSLKSRATKYKPPEKKEAPAA